MKKIYFVLFLLLLPVLSPAQGNTDDSIALNNLYNTPGFREELKLYRDVAYVALSAEANTYWFWPTTIFEPYSGATFWGISLAGVGFIISIAPAWGLTELKNKMISCGFDKVPFNLLYRKMKWAQTMAVATTMVGFSSLGFTICGLIAESDWMFGIGIAGIITGTVLSSFVPGKIQAVIDLYDSKKPDSGKLSLGISGQGAGLVYRFH